ncbi:hypothetical protein BTO32_15010 [Marinobacter lutaoensis]|uniref:Uncharacterized protein n=1 Tax=Marinobacter lutaoensis TaxID=135739 RepID=A0A1V2DPT8_9GAMM|nr:hypothetical protein [Marinobacter lutaoensis]ONF42520.1 hypothetical protein BTO32_15010 [Marinobacter lutaoensis]
MAQGRLPEDGESIAQLEKVGATQEAKRTPRLGSLAATLIDLVGWALILLWVTVFFAGGADWQSRVAHVAQDISSLVLPALGVLIIGVARIITELYLLRQKL